MHQPSSASLCRSAISVLVATALCSPIALAPAVEYGETAGGVVLEKDIQLVHGATNSTKINPGGEQHIQEFGVSSSTEINGGYQHVGISDTAKYAVLNDGYQTVQMGGAVNQATIDNGVLQVYDVANDPMIKGGHGDAAFTLGNAGSVVDISTHEHTLLDNGNRSWSLAENRVQMPPSTTDVSDMVATQPLVLDVGLDTVRGHLGSVKNVNYNTAMWSPAINSRNNVNTDAGASLEQILASLTLGIDSRFSREGGSMTQAGVVWMF